MAQLGQLNPMPHVIGGPSSRAEQHYYALRSAVGEGGAAKPGTLEDYWRACKAEWIATALIAPERAAEQALPHIATDLLPYYERLLGQRGTGELETRRREAASGFTFKPEAPMPLIEVSLQQIDPGFTVDEVDEDLTATTRLGKLFPARGYEVDLGVPERPNFSTDFVQRVRFELDDGDVSIPAGPRRLAVEHLNEVLPAWVDWQIVIAAEEGSGFRCDGGPDGRSLLGQKLLGW